MNKNLRMRIFVVFCVLLVSVYYVYPTIRWAGLSPDERKSLEKEWQQRDAEMTDATFNTKLIYSMEKWLRGDPRRVLNLGLDLKGGMHVVLQVEMENLGEEAKKDAVPRAVEIIRNRVDEFGIAEPVIFPEGRDRIVVQLPGILDPERAIKLIGRTALLEFKLVAEDKLTEKVLNRINEKKPILTNLESERGSTSEGVAYTYWQIPEKKLHLVEAILNAPEIKGLIPGDYEFLYGRSLPDLRTREIMKGLFLVKKEPIIKGISLKNAQIGRGNMFQSIVHLDFDREGMRKLRIVSGEAERRYKNPQNPVVTRLGIVLDDVVYSAPLMLVKLDSSPIIEGKFTVEEARDLAIVLRAGALPAPVKIAENRVVGPSLGHDSIIAGVKSSLVGLFLVVLFMAVYYLRAGVIADFALMVNALIVIAVLSLFRATLTLPGIAGIILTLGMAVDANVLISERMREELALGRKVRAAIANGYNKAFVTIVDSNLTTLIAALILYWIGTGPVRGFAVTLSIGIITSMWTSLFVTRVIFDSLSLRESFTKVRMLQFFKMQNIDFIGKMWYAVALSLIVIAIGMFSFFHKGWRNNFGVDFTGGALQQFGFEKPVDIASIRTALREAGIQESMLQHVESGREVIVKTADEKSHEMLEAFKKYMPGNPSILLRSEMVGPVVGHALRQQAIIGLLLSFLAIIVYVWWRFRKPQYGIAGVLALVHDIMVTVGLCALTNRPIDLGIVAALLTIVGFSINDTIVIFDRIREDLKLTKKISFKDIINLAINQCMSRTIITSFTALLTVICLFIWGGSVIHDFCFALLVGMISGVYSTVYIAAPVLILWPGMRKITGVTN
ncbi:MAG: protein translocase subunit SecD [Candidatus Aureabacteria bacterium]|nr:protein translocase subunit SecD [Candidatus Auribacterota bacterium]